MLNQFSRAELLVGKEAIQKLNKCKVAIFGIGGVGSYVVEGLARAGIGNFILIDNDKVDITNINRQLIATMASIGKSKVDVAKQRILDINPDANVETIQELFMPDSKAMFDEKTDYVVDCVDTVTAKIELVIRAKRSNIPIISCMGTGNKIDPTRFEVADIYKTSVCPLAKVIRKELRARGIDSLKVVYSKEEPIQINCQESKRCNTNQLENKTDCKQLKKEKQVTGSISFVPSVAGLIIAGEVVKDIINKK